MYCVKKKIHSKSKALKMSEMVLQFAGDYIRMGDDLDDRQNLLNSACSAWNISLLKPKKREKAIRKYVKEYKRYNPDVDDQNCRDMQENLEKLVSEKERLFPDEKRRIVKAEIEAKNGKEHYNVMFIKGF